MFPDQNDNPIHVAAMQIVQNPTGLNGKFNFDGLSIPGMKPDEARKAVALYIQNGGTEVGTTPNITIPQL